MTPTRSPVLFIHLMKTGGTTLMRNLRETFALDEIYPYRDLDIRYDDGQLDIQHHLSVPYLLTLSDERWAHIRVLTGHFPYVVHEILGRDFLTVTILRDPVERTISLLRQLKRNQPWENASGLRPRAARTLAAVYDEPLVFGPLIQNHQTKIFSMTTADNPQTYMDMIEIDQSRLDLAKTNLAQIDVVGEMENFQEFLRETQERFGWRIVQGARKNATPDADIEPVDPGLRRRIAADNAIDIEFYEYAKELVASRRRG